MRPILATLILVTSMAGCVNPFFGCQAESRFAEYKGRLGEEAPLMGELTARDSGRIYLSLDQTRGSSAQEAFTISVNIWSFASTVGEVHVHEREGSRAGRLLLSTSSGLLVRDSIWNTFPQLYSGPVSWQALWDALNDDNAYLEVHTADGQPAARGRLTLARSRGYEPSCT